MTKRRNTTMSVIPIKGRTTYIINLDPSVWIFDNRKIDLNAFKLEGLLTEVDARETTGDYGIPFKPFLTNAEPLPEATSVICHQSNGDSVTIQLEDALESILAFSQQGRPLKDGGLIHLYLTGEKKNEKVITHITFFEVE
jgi:DMSO/TMAO reductase YedYZ molybdopterin-dependent catalytic subunit